MEKFSMNELSKAKFPITAFQVGFSVQGDGEKPKPRVETVTLNRYISAYDRLHFTNANGIESHCSSLNFFRSAIDAQKHIDFAYNWKASLEIIHA